MTIQIVVSISTLVALGAIVHWDSYGIDLPLSVYPFLSDKDAMTPPLVFFVSPFVYGENL